MIFSALTHAAPIALLVSEFAAHYSAIISTGGKLAMMVGVPKEAVRRSYAPAFVPVTPIFWTNLGISERLSHYIYFLNVYMCRRDSQISIQAYFLDVS